MILLLAARHAIYQPWSGGAVFPGCNHGWDDGREGLWVGWSLTYLLTLSLSHSLVYLLIHPIHGSSHSRILTLSLIHSLATPLNRRLSLTNTVRIHTFSHTRTYPCFHASTTHSFIHTHSATNLFSFSLSLFHSLILSMKGPHHTLSSPAYSLNFQLPSFPRLLTHPLTSLSPELP